MSFDEAVMAVRMECPNIHAQWYADCAMDIAEKDGIKGLLRCAEDIIVNIRGWNHPHKLKVQDAMYDFIDRNHHE